MREETCPSNVATGNGYEAQCLYPVEKLLPWLKLIDIRRCGPSISFVYVTRIV